MENQKKLGPIAFLPLIVFLLLYVGCGITFTLMGAESPFDILPAVWLASALSVTAGILAAKLFARIWRRGGR